MIVSLDVLKRLDAGHRGFADAALKAAVRVNDTHAEITTPAWHRLTQKMGVAAVDAHCGCGGAPAAVRLQTPAPRARTLCFGFGDLVYCALWLPTWGLVLAGVALKVRKLAGLRNCMACKLRRRRFNRWRLCGHF